MEKREKNMLFFGGILIFLMFIIGTKERTTIQAPLITGEWDISEQVAQQNLGKYLIEEEDFDYSNPQILMLAQDIKSSTSTPFDAVKVTAKYVYDNVRYSSKISISYCYEETASLVLEKGTGDCVSMSRLVVSLLRAQGIPARTVGGCLSSRQRCTALFVAYPLIEAQVTPMEEGDFKKRGFLHEWVEFFDVRTGEWLIIESTSSQIFDTSCNSYMFYSYDSNKYDRCVISSQTFWSQCSLY